MAPHIFALFDHFSLIPLFGFPTWRSCFCCVGLAKGFFFGFITRDDFLLSLKYFWEIKLWLRQRKWLKLLIGSPPHFFILLFQPSFCKFDLLFSTYLFPRNLWAGWDVLPLQLLNCGYLELKSHSTVWLNVVDTDWPFLLLLTLCPCWNKFKRYQNYIV